MKVAIYARVSMEEKDKGNSRYQDPMNQIEPLENWAKGQGWEIHDIYVDRGSGANPARKEWRRLMNDAMLRKFKTILVWKLDRFSREGISQVFAYVNKLNKRGIALRSFTETWLDTSEENMMRDITLAVMAWAAAFEREQISRRTKAGIQRRKNLGVYKGGRPKGSKDKKERKKRGVTISYV